MHHEFIQKLTNIVEANLANEKFDVSQLAREMGMSRSNLHRQIKSVTHITVSQFICQMRLKKAKELLLNDELTVSEISYRVGFGSPTYFSKCFHDYFGFAPGELRNQVSGDENDEQPAENKPKTSKRTKILIGLFVGSIITVPAVFLLIQKLTFSNEKSIAVLPFINDSHDSANVFFINGVSEAITDKLSQIKDLKVTSRNSVERYRNTKTKSTPRIGRELGVKYIVEGSGQRIGDSVLVYVQLIDARSDKHILSRQYSNKYEDIFSLYTEIALDVATEIKAYITPEEKQLIEKPPTEKTEAMRMLIQGNELLGTLNISNKQQYENVRKAEVFFRKAIQLDSTYTDAWVQLGSVCLNKNKSDTALFLAKKALQLDNKNSEAYLLLGKIYYSRFMADSMKEALTLAIKYDENNSWAYHSLGGLYFSQGEFSKAMSNLLKAQKLIGELDPDFSNAKLWQLEWNTLHLFRTLFALGFYDEGKKYAAQWLKLSNDDYWGYNYNMQWAEIINCRFDESYQLGLKNYSKETDLINYRYMGMSMLYLKKFNESIPFLNLARPIGNCEVKFLIGYALLNTGRKKEAEKYFEAAINYYDSLLIKHPEKKETGFYYDITDGYWIFPYFILTATWAARGNKEKALENMRLLQQNYKANDLQVVTFLKYFPMFDNIRNEPEFQAYLKEAEAHYNTEHKKVEKLLLKEGILK